MDTMLDTNGVHRSLCIQVEDGLGACKDVLRSNLLPWHAQAEANMHDEMFGHLLAAMRFGADEAACLAAIEVAFR